MKGQKSHYAVFNLNQHARIPVPAKNIFIRSFHRCITYSPNITNGLGLVNKYSKLYIVRGLRRWPRGVADVDGQGSGGRHYTGGRQRAWTDDVRRPAAGAGEGRGDSTVRGLRRAAKPQSSVDGRSGRRASRRPKSSRFRLVCIKTRTVL